MNKTGLGLNYLYTGGDGGLILRERMGFYVKDRALTVMFSGLTSARFTRTIRWRSCGLGERGVRAAALPVARGGALLQSRRRWR